MHMAGADYEFINYPGTKHSFTNPEATERGKQFSLPLEYNETADWQSWMAMQKLFAEAL